MGRKGEKEKGRGYLQCVSGHRYSVFSTMCFGIAIKFRARLQGKARQISVYMWSAFRVANGRLSSSIRFGSLGTLGGGLSTRKWQRDSEGVFLEALRKMCAERWRGRRFVEFAENKFSVGGAGPELQVRFGSLD